MKKYSKVLIANRGEIAIRVLRSCKELGISTVSIHSSADENSLHVKLADESVCVGPAKSADSYLNIHAILSAAQITGAQAIHPGYGFLSENAEFAKMCQDHGIEFIGPNTQCLISMGDKIESKKIAKEAGVPTLEPIYIKSLSDKDIIYSVEKMGLPVLIKASAGGGGRGMKKIESMDSLLSAIKVLEKESLAAFGDDTLFIEKYVEDPRHIEVQILADKVGNVIHLGERDCTIQRRFQKIVEESPSPVLSEEVRQDICDAAVRLSKFVKYDSVGTVEFLYDQNDQKFYFMEMNTRIQVEHPVTEQRCGIDLISQQILVSIGAKLNLKQSDIKFSGHVIECRINAENPDTGMPSPGLITHYHRPGGLGIRVDDFIYTGYEVVPFYDSMISKIIVKASDRNSCIARTLRALDETVVGGIKTNIEQHKKILNNSDFRENQYNTNFLNEKLL
ncbi:MAG: acetyl-CoA carboxylase biotin carboxylase subunit [Bacteriovoracaceae bacterium]|jgi:acetyl-CoA carboxylase biotin carboxylase subunit|nr:acetyl-CoA carboxylase biotin carboxylase subunit [Bacteriovoracaceae bacterium]